MSFELEQHEPVAKGLRRVFTEELQSAAKMLQPPESEDRDRAIHEARKSVKKVRGVLRLLQPQLGPDYKKVNTQLRGIGRKLSAFRDAGAMLETVTLLEKAYPKDLGKAKLAALKTALKREKTKAEHEGNLDTVFEDLAAELQSLAAQAEHWKLKGKGFDAIAKSFQKSFRQGRKAMDQALSEGSDIDFHEWRKRVKDHWYHVRLLQPCDEKLAAYGKLLKNLETWLGDDHNLVVLHQNPLLSKNTAAQTLAARQRDELRAKSVELGRELYGVKPGKLTAMVRESWEAW